MRTYEELMEDEELDLETDSQAMVEMAACLLAGNGCTQDKEKGEEWLKKAAAANDPKAMEMLQELQEQASIAQPEENDISYEQMTKVQLYNQAIQGDFQAALAFTKQAAESLPHEVFQLLKEIVQQDCDDYEALKELQYYLGTFYEKGIGKNHELQDYKRAYECYYNALELGNEKAAGKLAVLFEQGHGVNRDFEKARELRLKYGTYRDKFDVAMHYMNGVFGGKSLLKALQLFDEIASQNSDRKEFYIANFYLAKHQEHTYMDFEHVLQHLKDAAAQGDVECIRLLMEAYEQGDFLPHDLDLAIQYCTQLYQLSDSQQKKEKLYEKRMHLIAASASEDEYIQRKQIVQDDLNMDLLGICYGFVSSAEKLEQLVQQSDRDAVRALEISLRNISNTVKPQNKQGEKLCEQLQNAISTRLQEIKTKQEEENQRQYDEFQRQKKEKKEKEVKEFREKRKPRIIGFGIVLLICMILHYYSIIAMISLIGFGVSVYEWVKGEA